ncbi:MAG: plasmid mobilization relaxosome protein MobC [Pseudomonadota bacterium]
MARPKKSPRRLRSEQLNISLSPDERAEIEARAGNAGMTLIDFARAAALNKPIQMVEEARPDFETRHELRRIGNNINQLVKLCHRKTITTTTDIVPYLEKLNQLMDHWLDHGAKNRKSRS